MKSKVKLFSSTKGKSESKFSSIAPLLDWFSIQSTETEVEINFEDLLF